jgi:hypothetical protein
MRAEVNLQPNASYGLVVERTPNFNSNVSERRSLNTEGSNEVLKYFTFGEWHGLTECERYYYRSSYITKYNTKGVLDDTLIYMTIYKMQPEWD